MLLPSLLLLAGAVSALSAEDPFATELLAELNRARTDRGLAALELDPQLVAVADARAASMASEGWFGFRSPAGREVEDELDAAGYAFRLVTEKLARTNGEARALVDEWRLRPGEQAQSLFHPEVTQVGVGVAASSNGRILDVVLATPMAAGPRVLAAPADPGSARSELLELIAEEREKAKLRPLATDALLDEAAQEHAVALQSAFASAKGPESIESVEKRISNLELRRQPGAGGLTQSRDAFNVREIQAAGSGRPIPPGEIGLGIVTDASRAADVLATLAAAGERPVHLDPTMMRLGIGLASPPTPGARTVWVLVTRRR